MVCRWPGLLLGECLAPPAGGLGTPVGLATDRVQAVSVALERAKETIYIADWWLSPELVSGRTSGTNGMRKES